MRSSATITGTALLSVLLTLSLPACGNAGEGDGAEGQTFFAGQTDENGQVILKIADRNVPLKFVDETLGCPISALSVGVACDPNVPGMGVMLIVDPFEDYPLQVVLLFGQTAASSNSPGQLSVQGGPSADANNVMNIALAKTITTTKDTWATIKALTLNFYLGDAARASFAKVDDSLQFMYLIANTAKWLDKAGLPVGEFAGRVGTTEILTKQEAMDQLSSSWNLGQVKRVFFFSTSILTGAFFPPAGAAGVLPAGAALAIGAVVDPFTALLDFQTIVSCDDKIVVTTLGTARFYACYKPPKVSYVWPTKPLLCITVKDANGVPAARYKLDLIGTKNVTEVYLWTLDDQGQACIRVLPGDYKVRVFRPDASLAKTLDISVGAGETSLNIALPKRVAPDLFLKEIYTGGGMADLQMTTDPDGKDSGYGCLYAYSIAGLAVRLMIYESQQEGPWMVVLGSLTGTSEKRYVPREKDPDYCPDWSEARAPFTCTGVGGLPGAPIDIALAVRGKAADVLPGLPVDGIPGLPVDVLPSLPADAVPDESGGVRARFTDVRVVENGEKIIGTLIFESFPFENVRRENVTLTRQCRRFVDADELIQVTSQFVGIIP